MTLYLLQNFNDYYNRKIKRYSFLNDYLIHQSENNYEYTTYEGINFVFNDGITTEQIINQWVYSWIPDYLLVIDDNNKMTRWFITNSISTRGLQYKFILRRDVISDFYDEVINAPTFIEKATLQSNNSLIFNSENMTVNQIKTSETLLKDNTNCAWIVGYFDSSKSINANFSQTSYDKNFSTPSSNFLVNNNKTFKIIESIEYLSDWNEYDAFTGLNKAIAFNNKGYVWDVAEEVKGPTGVPNEISYIRNIKEWFNKDASSNINDFFKSSQNNTDNLDSIDVLSLENYLQSTGSGALSTLNYSTKNTYATESNGFINEYINELYTESNNKILRFREGEGVYSYYNCSYTTQSTKNTVIFGPGTTNGTSGNAFFTDYMNLIKNFPFYSSGLLGEYNYPYVKITYTEKKLVLNNVTSTDLSVNSEGNPEGPGLTRNILRDAPYSMFCIPYPKDETVIFKNTGSSYGDVTIDAEAGFNIAQAIATSLGGTGTSFLYDLQLLPYCPMYAEIIEEDGTIDLKNNTLLYAPILSNNTAVSYILFSTKSSFTNRIYLNNPIIIKNTKIESMTDMYRLVSPNYNGQFEFNAAKNNGISYFEINCTYKPYNPYIHINPNFGGLYGGDFNDARGLICAGDFSLPIIDNAFTDYQIMNKNYENIFNREIQSLELQNNIARDKQIYGSIGSILGGTVGGAMAGGAKGGVYGAIAGGVGGALTSTVGSVLNYNWSEQLREEALDYKNDMFGYTLGNIRALPQSIGKTTAFTINNKIFPILEYYTCTDTEKKALANKIAYNGMTVMTIGRIADYITNHWSYSLPGFEISSKGYIKGQIIRLENLDEDFHFANEIANEIYKGVYI